MFSLGEKCISLRVPIIICTLMIIVFGFFSTLDYIKDNIKKIYIRYLKSDVIYEQSF